jgi:anti-sigma factor RsiW
MNVTFQCGDSSALVAYLYDECEPGERESIAAHLERCITCAGEIDTLNATRRTLASWTPPEMSLGFQITRPEDRVPAKVLTPTIAWWRAPMPAWAQAAAAVLIFAGGLSIGLMRNTGAGEIDGRDAAVTPNPAAAAVTTVSRDELAQLEQRLKNEMALMRTTATSPVPARAGDDALMQQVKALIEQGNEDQRRDFTRRMVELANNFETQRRVDLANVRQSVGQLQGAVGTELRQQREVNERFNNLLINVSERSR